MKGGKWNRVVALEGKNKKGGNQLMKLYYFTKHFYNRIKKSSHGQKCAYARAIGQTQSALIKCIEGRDLEYIRQGIAKSRGQLARKFLANALTIMSGQPLKDFMLKYHELDIDGFVDVEFFSIINIPKRELIVVSYGPTDVVEDLSLLRSLIEEFDELEFDPAYYSIWNFYDATESVVYCKRLNLISKNEITRKASELNTTTVSRSEITDNNVHRNIDRAD